MTGVYNTIAIQPASYNTSNYRVGFGKDLIESDFQDGIYFSNAFLKERLAHKLKEQGDDYANNSQDKKAIEQYKKAIKEVPEYISPYYNLARLYEKRGKIDEAITTYQALLVVKPDEVEAMTLMGLAYKEKKDYNSAKAILAQANHVDPKYDFASRTLKEINYILLAKHNPVEAEKLKQKTAEKNLKEALILVHKHAAPDLTRNLNSLAIVFDETDSLSGHKNIAQYENHNKKIVITSDYIWAAPEVTAAYIVHEAVHAKDRDGISSIKEEQDSYEASIKFWVTHNNGLKDPELDYAAELYRENPKKLRQKVGDTYRSRDGSMLEYSPYHTPPEGLGFMAKIKLQAIILRNKFVSMVGIS